MLIISKCNKLLKFQLSNFHEHLKLSSKLITLTIHIEHLHSTVQTIKSWKMVCNKTIEMNILWKALWATLQLQQIEYCRRTQDKSEHWGKSLVALTSHIIFVWAKIIEANGILRTLPKNRFLKTEVPNHSYIHMQIHLSQTANAEFLHCSFWQHPAHLELKSTNREMWNLSRWVVHICAGQNMAPLGLLPVLTAVSQRQTPSKYL